MFGGTAMSDIWTYMSDIRAYTQMSNCVLIINNYLQIKNLGHVNNW